MKKGNKDAVKVPEKPKREYLQFTAASKKVGKAIVDFGMIGEGDRIAVGVSGGKDSLSLLHILRDRQRMSPVRFEFTAVHVDFGFKNFDCRILEDHFRRHDFSYLIEKTDAFKGQREEDLDCFWCSRNRRKALFIAADREGFTKIAFGHHMDDIAETIILNQFYRGEIAAMKPRLELFDGKIVIIRPLAYLREHEIERVAQELGIHSLGQLKCGHEDKTHRMRIKKMLRDFEKVNPMVVTNIFHSLQRVRPGYLIEPTED